MQPSRRQWRGRYGPATLRPFAVSLAAARHRLPAQMGGRCLELAPALLQVSRGRGRPAQTGDSAECWPRSPPRRWAWPGQYDDGRDGLQHEQRESALRHPRGGAALPKPLCPRPYLWLLLQRFRRRRRPKPS
ncbi:hypothetical protein ACQJBY_029991 [Aegilops geniculata]